MLAIQPYCNKSKMYIVILQNQLYPKEGERVGRGGGRTQSMILAKIKISNVLSENCHFSQVVK